MATTENNYTGNGSKTDYSITFQYLDDDDIKVSLDGVLTTAYTLSNATTVLFSSAPANGVLIRIYRDTNVDSLKSTFFAGSSIRAQDLNKNFEQNNYAVQEIQNYTWDNETDTIHSDETWASSDTQIATTAAMDARFWDQDTDTIDSTETWQDSDSYIPTAGAVDSAIDEAITNDIATDGTGITVTDDGDGTITLGLAANTIDLDRIKNEDIVTYAEQNAGSPSWDSDSRIPTTYASARRHDCLVQTSTPTGSDWQVGKMWVQNDSDRTVHIWDGTQWLPIASGGAFTTLPKVVYVDSINGDDSYEAHRLSNPKKTIKSAIDDINADPNGDGSIVVVAPGIYGETFPIDIQKNDVAIVGTSLRNCIIHPAIPAADQAGYDVDVPEANELQIMFRVNSGSYFYGLTLQGMKASGTRGGNALDTDATYGLPTNQGWNFAFYPGATIKKSPYIQNCTNFSDSQINNVNFTPHVPGEGAAGDLDSGFAGGGILIDGSTPASNSPLRSMVCDSYTHTALNGPGIFVTNNGYCQATSSYSFFNHFHLKTKNGGQANLAASTTDFGNYSLIADGRSTNAIFTAATTAGASANDTTFTINAPTAGPDWHGSATRPQDNMLVDIGGNTYPVLSAVAAGSGWTVTISRPDPANLSQNLGLQNNVASGASANFYLRSMIASSGHTMEYVGSGTDYRALPENGGVPNEARQKTELNNGKIWAAITDHKGKFIIGDTFSVDQQTGFIETGSGSFAIPRLIVDLDLNGNTISDSTGNVVVDDTLSMNSNKIVNVTDPTAAQDAATKAYVDALQTSLEGGSLDNLYFRQDTGETINSGDTWSSSDLSIATTGAIDARIVDLVDDVGGFVPINDENSFPATNPDINDGAGTLISIQEISTSRTPSGGTVTIANGSGSNTVTINNCGTTVLAAGYGCIVETTTTLHTYNFHRLTPLATEVSTVAANVTPINTVATNISDVTTVSTDIASVVTVANDLNEPVSEIDTVATNITNVNNVGNNITDVTTVSGSISNVNTVASDITNVNNTGTYIANVNTVAGQISPTNNVATVAGVASDIPTVAGISSNVTTVAGISSNVTTVAGISGNVTTVAGISSDVTTVANNNTNVSTVATNITDVNTFANRYRIASSDPTTSLDTGDLVFNTTSNELRVYNGTAWQGGVTATGNLVSKSGDTMLGNLSFGGSYKVTNLATPTATGDAATKGYVDTQVAGAGTVTSVATGTGLTGGPITSTGTISLANTAVTAGSYTTANITVDAQGRITAASSGTSGVTDIDGLSDARANTTTYVHLGNGAGGTSLNGTALGVNAGAAGIGSQCVHIGKQAGYNITGIQNTFVGENSGYGAGGVTSSPGYNTALGVNTLYSITSGDNNVVIGFEASTTLTTGNENTIVGSEAGGNLTTGGNNVCLGNLAGWAVSTQSNNTFVGNQAGYGSYGNSMVCVGASAGGDSNGGAVSVYVGSYSGYYQTGNYNVAVGSTALRGTATATASYNVAIGPSAGYSVSTGSQNVFVGGQSGYAVTTNGSITALGYYAGRYSGAESVWVGFEAGVGASGGSTSSSVGVGKQALTNATSFGNTAVGYEAGKAVTTGTNNTFIGRNAGYHSSPLTIGTNNICLGFQAETSSNSVSNEVTIGNTSITKFRVPGINFVLKDNGGTPTTGQVLTADASGEGYWATLSAGATSIDGLSDGKVSGQNYGLGGGSIFSLTSGSNNVGYGYRAIYSITTGSNNTGIGNEALEATSTGSHNTALGHWALTNSNATGNTAVGYRALDTNTSGQYNTALGYQAMFATTTGQRNTALGINAGSGITTGSYNVCLGDSAGDSISTGQQNIVIGRNASNVTEGDENVFIGDTCGSGATLNSSRNTYVGAGVKNGSGNGDENSCFGYQAGQDLTTGHNNAFFGKHAGWNVTSGNRNTIVGSQAGDALLTGDDNIIIGFNASASSTSVHDEATIGSAGINKFRVPGVDFVVEGHAWVNFQGTGTVSIRDSNNVSSVTDNGTGDYTVNFTNSFPNASYAWALNARNDDNNASSQSFVGVTANCETPSTSSFRMSAVTPVNNTKQDHKYIVGQFFH